MEESHSNGERTMVAIWLAVVRGLADQMRITEQAAALLILEDVRRQAAKIAAQERQAPLVEDPNGCDGT
jgi:hypothetical protein